jgi:hypothetical protein
MEMNKWEKGSTLHTIIKPKYVVTFQKQALVNMDKDVNLDMKLTNVKINQRK